MGNLSVDRKIPRKIKFPVPIILLHGAWHGKWAMSWLSFFLVSLGFECYILGFRGHEDRDNKDKRIWHTLIGYLEDLERLTRSMAKGLPPVIVGHSMGGLVAQMYAKKNPVSALILLASIPPSGALKMFGRFALKYLWLAIKLLLTMNMYLVVKDTQVVKKLLFSEKTSSQQAKEWQKKLVNESFLAYLQMLLPRFLSHQKMHSLAPVLVFHGNHDGLVTEEESRRTAQVYGADWQILQCAHCEMLSNREMAKVTAQKIAIWLQAQNISPS